MQDAMLAACVAMFVTFIAGQPTLGLLRRLKFGKSADLDAPETYASKAGTLTMGGVIFLSGVFVASVPFAVVENTDLLLPMMAMLVAAGLGGVDDFQALLGSKVTGHELWFWFLKWGALILIGLAISPVLYFHFDLDAVLVPHFGSYSLGAAYLPIAVVVFVVATSGAVITDGMDGLMAGVSAFGYAAYGTIALSQGQEELGAFAFAVVGACAAFLWFNAYPAQVFMGDLGSQALSVGLVVVAFMTGWWLLLPLIGVIFVAEGASDVIQIASFKTTGHRVFRMAPIHYHFQMGGWTETQVVAMFWLIAMFGALAGIALVLWN